MKRHALAWVICCSLFFCSSALADGNRVTLSKTPDNGIQPQTVMDAKGNLHLIYFEGALCANNK